jgi:hypothetical protein
VTTPRDIAQIVRFLSSPGLVRQLHKPDTTKERAMPVTRRRLILCTLTILAASLTAVFAQDAFTLTVTRNEGPITAPVIDIRIDYKDGRSSETLHFSGQTVRTAKEYARHEAEERLSGERPEPRPRVEKPKPEPKPEKPAPAPRPRACNPRFGQCAEPF